MTHLFKYIEPEWISAITGLTALILAVFEYYFRRRPYLKIDVEVIKENGGYHFKANVVNFGTSPAYFTVKKEDVCIKIGDEQYFSAQNIQAYAFPTDKEPPSFEIGHVNTVGISRLLKGEYKDNTSHIFIKMNYYSNTEYSFFSKIFSYAFQFRYGIEFSKDVEDKIKVTVFVLEQRFV